MLMDIQRLRSLTTGMVHTSMEDAHQDLEYLVGCRVWSRQIPVMRATVQPHLREHLKDERFWDGKLDPTHVGTVEVPPMRVKLYNIMVENLETGVKVSSGFEACTHDEACILMKKMTKYDWRRIYLEEVK